MKFAFTLICLRLYHQEEFVRCGQAVGLDVSTGTGTVFEALSHCFYDTGSNVVGTVFKAGHLLEVVIEAGVLSLRRRGSVAGRRGNMGQLPSEETAAIFLVRLQVGVAMEA